MPGTPARPDGPTPEPNTTTTCRAFAVPECGAESGNSRGDERSRPATRGRLGMIMLALKPRLSEAGVLHERLSMPSPRVRGANAMNERGATACLKPGNNSAGNKA